MRAVAPHATPNFDPAAAYPAVAVLKSALARRDWPGVRAVFAELPPAGRSTLVHIGGGEPEVEDFLREALTADPDDTLAASMLGYHLIKTGWAVRTTARAKYVSREKFAIFHDYLRKAEQILIDAAARDPADVSVWVNRLVSARGLQLGLSEVRRRYDRLAGYDPHHLPGQTQLLQSLCPKWSGTWEQMHAFARECMLAAPEGSLNAVLVVEGHLERWVDLNGGSAGERYLRSGPVRDEIHEAASRSVWHPNFQRGYGWVGVQNTFAMVFGLMEDHQAAATQFVALGELATEDPWDYLGDPAEQFVRWRKQAMAAGVAK